MFKMKSLWAIAALVAATTVAIAQSATPGTGGGPGDVGGKTTPTQRDANKAVCFGDGSGTKCPLNNPGQPGHGCNNSADMGGALLRANGLPSVARDSVVLSVRGLPFGTTAIYMQSDNLALKSYAFGDGLMCIGGPLTRISHVAVKSSFDSTSRYPEFGEPSLSLAGNIPASGGTVYYQVLYRDRHMLGVHSNFNLSNGWCTVWVP